MRLAAMFATVSLAFAQQAEIRNPHTTPADIAAGAKIFRGHCGECHGLKGEGGRGPSLTGGVYYHGSTDADLLRNISDGIPGTAMPGVFFSPDQVWQVVSYVRTLSQAREPKPNGNAARGEQLFRDKGCLQCHIVRGEGGVHGPDLTVIGSQRSSSHLREAILQPGAKVLREHRVAKVTMENGAVYSGFIMNEGTFSIEILDSAKGLKSLLKSDLNRMEIATGSSMPSVESQLRPADVNDIVSYLWSLQRNGRAQ